MTTIEAMKQALEASRNHAGNYKLTDAECDVQIAAETALLEAISREEAQTVEPTLYQFRTAPARRDDENLWYAWTDCSAEAAAGYMKTPKLHDWDYEVRELFTRPAPSADVKPASSEREALIASMEKQRDWAEERDYTSVADSLGRAIDMLAADAPFQPDWVSYRQGVEDGKAEAQQVAVPQGWKLVPVEPTDDMCEAAWNSDGVDYVGEYQRIHRADLAYAAMLAAAPQPPQGE